MKLGPEQSSTDADEDGDFTDRDGRTRDIWIFSNTREIKPTLN